MSGKEAEAEWTKMIRRSFHPSEWWARDDHNQPVYKEDFAMWVYRKTETSLWTVGYYSPSGEWMTDSDHDTKEAAAVRVHYLNGGK